MPEKYDRCIQHVMSSGKTEEQAHAICTTTLRDGHYSDRMPYDPETRTAIAVRDGVQEYLGHELGIMSAPDQRFTVYRSPATVANAAFLMAGIPVTDGHVDPDSDPPTDGGTVQAASLIDLLDQSTATTVAVQVRLVLSDELAVAVANGTRELSLGYRADLVPHGGQYDFEQRDIRPHHQAVVDRGRCGPVCQFTDNQPPQEEPAAMPDAEKKKPCPFLDADGQPNIDQIAAMAAELPAAIRAIPVDQLGPLVEPIRAILEAAKTMIPEAVPEPEPAEQMEDEETMTEEEKKAQFADAVSRASDAAVAAHVEAIEHARQFVDEGYTFKGKTTAQVMADAVATQYPGAKFTDAELAVAFKLLKKPAEQASRYPAFGDHAATDNKFAGLVGKEIC